MARFDADRPASTRVTTMTDPQLDAPHGVIARFFARFRRPQPRPLYAQRSHVRLIREETGRG